MISKKGGFEAMGKALARGMVLVMSLWDDGAAEMCWLDCKEYPTTADPSTPGVVRGPCANDSGNPATVRKDHPDSHVTFSNIKFGELNSTYTPPGPDACAG